jgi:hypothetical protein
MHRHTINNISIRHSRIVPITTPLVLREFVAFTLYGEKGIEGAPSVVAGFAFGEREVQGDGSLV